MAILLHGVFLLAIFATAGGVAPRGAQDVFGEGEAIEVSLAGSEGAAAGGGETPAARAEADPLDRLNLKLRNENSELFVGRPEPSRPSGSVQSLFEAMGIIKSPGRRSDGRQASGDSKFQSMADRTQTSSRTGRLVRDDGSAGLWGQIEPCWNRLPRRSAATVTLELTLDTKGGLAKPPKILRADAGTPTEQQLLAEEQALAAIQACLPYETGDVGQSRRYYIIAFRAGS